VSGELIVNPHVTLKVIRDGGAIQGIEVRAPVRGDRLRTTKIASATEPSLFGTLLVQSATGAVSDEGFSADERARLADIGVLVAPDRISGKVWFTSDLDNPAYDLVPRRAPLTPRPPVDSDDLALAPTLRWLGPEGPPREMRGRVDLPNRFDPNRSWLAIDDPVTAVPAMYSSSPALEASIRAVQSGRTTSRDFSADVRRHLVDAEVLQSPAITAARRDMRHAQLTQGHASMNDRRYAVFKELLAPLQVAAIRRYYRTLIADGHLPFGDVEWPDRFFSKHDAICHVYHHQMTDLVSALVGRRVKPSFNFFAAYHRRAELPPHRDREQCTWSMSVLIDHAPEPADESPWPLYLQPPGASAATPISIGLGDAILYYGQEVRHHRLPLTEADYCTYWFFFYVPEDFDGPLD